MKKKKYVYKLRIEEPEGGLSQAYPNEFGYDMWNGSGRRRHYFSLEHAKDRAARLRRHGATVTILRSQPLEFTVVDWNPDDLLALEEELASDFA